MQQECDSGSVSVWSFKVLIFALLFKSVFLHQSIWEGDGPVKPCTVLLPW